MPEWIEELERLAALRDQGALTEAQYQAALSKMLSSPATNSAIRCKDSADSGRTWLYC